MESATQPVALDEILGELAQPLLRYLERYVGNRAIAEDLLQETLLRMAQGFSSFEGRASVKTWAFSIASRVAADHLRHPDRRVNIVELEEAGEQADPALDGDERMVVDQMNACVRQVIDSLPDTFRAALILHDLEELSAQETARICDCSIATAKIRIHRARLRLKQALQAQCAFYSDREGVYRCDRKQ
jgi:RNA polymerase sigma-70 factor, ECF subfamily